MKSNGTSCKIPDKSILKKDSQLFDYSDSYQGSFSDDEGTIDSTRVGILFFSGKSKVTGLLFAIRNKIVGLFGLKTSGQMSDRQKLLNHFKCEPGEQRGLFRVFEKTENEVVLGEDDKHLNFRVSLFLDRISDDTGKKSLTITTTVKYNNLLGRVYFIFVRPFHKLIVPAMLKGMIKRIESEKSAKF
ncbi:DUF2867 domain-containing protein [Pontibacter sp. BT310]|uniref:DUF2867 domain-containing protein n=1 Tax=Pontibacter populi TaxID=890055 RepID=A0ABS6XAI2_9BACT|nr:MULTISPECIES: DUF2867 domain-containing protein [Pontibacter]MBJ6118033.1 DUF2867 domain-containing protein [Pontibacter sp. BT310]MBR0570460.1 DUF2867 domain-containing protein [Microvirga sp. STS03]MBW3364886.1 DUF2867 domain-containing protein [Pontibacter populi]